MFRISIITFGEERLDKIKKISTAPSVMTTCQTHPSSPPGSKNPSPKTSISKSMIIPIPGGSTRRRFAICKGKVKRGKGKVYVVKTKTEPGI